MFKALKPTVDQAAALEALAAEFNDYQTNMCEHLKEEEDVGLPMLRNAFTEKTVRPAVKKIIAKSTPQNVAYFLHSKPAAEWKPWLTGPSGQMPGFVASFSALLWASRSESGAFVPCSFILTQRPCSHDPGVQEVREHPHEAVRRARQRRHGVQAAADVVLRGVIRHACDTFYEDSSQLYEECNGFYEERICNRPQPLAIKQADIARLLGISYTKRCINNVVLRCDAANRRPQAL